MAKGDSAAADLKAATTMCVTSFVTFLQAAMSTMQTLEAAIDSPQHATKPESRVMRTRLFFCVWLFSCDACVGLKSCGLFLAGPAQPDLRPLQPVLNMFMAWLLKLIRLGKTTQRSLQDLFKGVQLQHLYKFMETSALVLHALDGGSSVEILRGVNSLPPGFISTLCCLACEVAPWLEQGSSAPYGLLLEVCVNEYTLLIRHLGASLGLILANPATMSSMIAANKELACPAAVEVAKRTVFACYTTPSLGMDLTIAAQTILRRTLTHCSPMPASLNVCPSSSCRPLHHTQPSSSSLSSLSPRIVTPDQNMLLLLLRCSVTHPDGLEASTNIMMCMVKRWYGKTAMWMDSRGPACAALVLRYCSHHLCCLIQQQQHAQQMQRQPGQTLHTTAHSLTQGQTLGLEMLMLLTLDLLIFKMKSSEWNSGGACTRVFNACCVHFSLATCVHLHARHSSRSADANWQCLSAP